MGISERGGGEPGKGKQDRRLGLKDAVSMRDAVLADQRHHVFDRLGLPLQGPDRDLGLRLLQVEISKGEIARTQRALPTPPLLEGRGGSVIDRLRRLANKPDTASLERAEQQIAAIRERYPADSDRPHQIGLAIHALVVNSTRTEGIAGSAFVPDKRFLERWADEWRAILGESSKE